MPNRLAWMAIPALLIAACSKPVPQDGFKQLTYGMTLTKLKREGFNCGPNNLCSREVSDQRYGTETLFGQPADVMVWTENGALDRIDVSVDMPSAQLEGQVTKEFGSPKSFEYSSFNAGRATQLIWLASNGTSISMVRPTAKTADYGQGRGSLTYNSKSATAKLLKRAQDASVKSGDF